MLQSRRRLPQIATSILLLFLLGTSVPAIQDPNTLLKNWDGRSDFMPDDTTDLGWMLDLNSENIHQITARALENRARHLEEQLQEHNFHYGQIWKARFLNPREDRVPTGHGPGADSALFTGMYLAASVYRYQVTRLPEDLAPIVRAVEGLYLVTHISGVPGVLARCAYPLEENHHLYEMLISKPHFHVRNDPMPRFFDHLDPNPYPPMWYQTRATRDQLTGVLYGLAVTWMEMPRAGPGDPPQVASDLERIREAVHHITAALFHHLKKNRFVIRDHLGKSGTSSRRVTGYLRLQLYSVYRRILVDILQEQKNETGVQHPATFVLLQNIRTDYDRYYKQVIGKNFVFDPFLMQWNHVRQYYAWNLRFMRAYTLFLCDTNFSRKGGVFERMRGSLWEASLLGSPLEIRDHQNTFFTLLYYDVLRDVWNNRRLYQRSFRLDEQNPRDNPGLDTSYLETAIWSLKGLSLRPMRSWPTPLRHARDWPHKVIPVYLRTPTQHFIWQKPPWFLRPDKYDPLATSRATGVDFLLPYWMGRAKFSDLPAFSISPEPPPGTME